MHASSLRAMALLVVSMAALRADEADITVFAAASTTDALREIAKAYEASTKVTVALRFAATSTLAKEITDGKHADIFISADEKWADYLEGRNWLKPGTRADLLANGLVVVAPLGKGFTMRFEKDFDLAGAFKGRLAVADPVDVPAGRYAKEAFTALGWWTKLEPRLEPCEDVRAALQQVEAGEAGAGVVYASDATPKVEVVGRVPEALHTPILYPMAQIVKSKPATSAFAVHLAGPAAAKVFAKYGFQPAIMPAK
jgi:molybdate transport system substrate-binding protein